MKVDILRNYLQVLTLNRTETLLQLAITHVRCEYNERIKYSKTQV